MLVAFFIFFSAAYIESIVMERIKAAKVHEDWDKAVLLAGKRRLVAHNEKI